MPRSFYLFLERIRENSHFFSQSPHLSKYRAEVEFWRTELDRYNKWFDSEITLYGENPPEDHQKIIVHSRKHSVVLTWAKVHQFRKYLEDLCLEKKAFAGLKILDIGSGPIPSACVFENCEIFCLDPLWGDYIKIGFPLHYYDRVKFVSGYSEDIPIRDHFFDAVISVNAIDHVDNFFSTAQEIQRVLKPNGLLRMHIHYHKKTETEPLELNDGLVMKAFEWCPGWHKIRESNENYSSILKNPDEKFTLWSNFT